MRIILEQTEVAAVVMNYARTLYKTNNVSVEAFKNGGIELLVTPDEDTLGEQPNRTMSEAQVRIMQRFAEEQANNSAAEPELPFLDNEPLV